MPVFPSRIWTRDADSISNVDNIYHKGASKDLWTHYSPYNDSKVTTVYVKESFLVFLT